MKKAYIFFVDILLVIFIIFAPHIFAFMIENGNECYFLTRGIICPSCGGTHCVYSFFTGDFKQALISNFAIFCGLLLAFFVIILLNVYVLFKSRCCIKIIRRISHPLTLAVFIGVYIIFGILRNFL